MIQRLKQIKGWQRALLFLAVALPFNLWLFPARTQYLQALSGFSPPTLDTWFGYTPAQAFKLLDALTEVGRTTYAVSEVTLDLLYPPIYTGLLAALLGWLAPLAFDPKSGWVVWLQRLPRVVLVSDYLENIGVVTLLLVFPAQPAGLAWLVCGITIVKISLGVGCLAAAALAAVKCLLNRRKTG